MKGLRRGVDGLIKLYRKAGKERGLRGWREKRWKWHDRVRSTPGKDVLVFVLKSPSQAKF